MAELHWIDVIAINDGNFHGSTSLSQSRAEFSCAMMSDEGVFFS
jgi:hypothetical protein